MKLSKSQQAAVLHSESVALRACPGSGKTRTLVSKLIRLLEEVRATPRRLCAITYTNAAAHEAERRVLRLVNAADAHLFEVGTIHAFCLKNILGRHYWRLENWRHGFSIAAPDSEEYLDAARAAVLQQGLDKRALEKFELLSRSEEGEPVCESPLTQTAARDFWRLLEERGCLDFCTLLYESLRLLRRYPDIAKGVAARFAWILIDEFQDTNRLQLAIFELLAEQGRTRFFIVGDPHQSIFRFAGAQPQNLSEFAKTIRARTDLRLNDNYRSSGAILSVADDLAPREQPMRARGPYADDSEPVSYRHVATALSGITEVFLPRVDELGIPRGNCAVLAPWFWPLFTLGRDLASRGIPVFGPGVRPYNRRHLIAPLAESIAATVVNLGEVNRRALAHLLSEVVTCCTGRENPKIFGRAGRRTIQRILRLALEAHDAQLSASSWLPRLATIISDALQHHEITPPSQIQHKLMTSAGSIAAEARQRLADDSEFSVHCLAEFARPVNHVRLMTVHRSKGRQFDAVAIVHVHEGRYPHFSAISDEDVEDGRRALYVAITRARRLLMLFSDAEIEEPPSRFLEQAGLSRHA